jgi:hypothetical protein
MASNRLTGLDTDVLDTMPRLNTLVLDNNTLTELRADQLQSLPNLTTLHVRENQIAHLDAAWVDWARTAEHTLLLDGNPLYCGKSGPCTCHAGYTFAPGEDGTGVVGATCVPACTERVPRFYRQTCPERHVGAVCAVACDVIERGPASNNPPVAAQQFNFTCGPHLQWTTDAPGGGVCGDYLCAAGKVLDVNKDSSCVCPGFSAHMLRIDHVLCLGKWPQGVPPGVLEMQQIGRADFDSVAPGLLAMDLEALPKLKRLTIANSQLREIPEALLMAAPVLAGLSKLELMGNRMTRIPPGLTAFPALNVLDLSSNELTLLRLDEVRMAPLLESLSVRLNRITAILPPSAENQQPLSFKRLYLGGNQLTQLGAALVRLTRLEILDLTDNALTVLHSGSVPSFGRLRQLNLRDNDIRYIDRSVFLRSVDWAKLLPTPREALAGVSETTTDLFESAEVLPSHVAGFFMEGNPSNCSWFSRRDRSKGSVCDCDSGLKSVFACPELGSTACSTISDNLPEAGNATSLQPRQVCDQHEDCVGGADERGCSDFQLVLIEGDTNIGLTAIPYAEQDNCTSCFHILQGTVSSGRFRLVSQRNDGTGSCMACEDVEGFLVSENWGIAQSKDLVLRQVRIWFGVKQDGPQGFGTSSVYTCYDWPRPFGSSLASNHTPPFVFPSSDRFELRHPYTFEARVELRSMGDRLTVNLQYEVRGTPFLNLQPLPPNVAAADVFPLPRAASHTVAASGVPFSSTSTTSSPPETSGELVTRPPSTIISTSGPSTMAPGGLPQGSASAGGGAVVPIVACLAALLVIVLSVAAVT